MNVVVSDIFASPVSYSTSVRYVESLYLFRPGVIQPLHGIQSKTPAYQNFYLVVNPFLSLICRMCPGLIVTAGDIGQAMLNATRQKAGRVFP